MTDISLSSKISFLVASLNRQLEKEIQEHAHPLKLPMEQVRILEALYGAGSGEGLSMSEVAQLVVIDASTLTKVIDRMIAGNLVYRTADPGDRRRVKVLLTQKGGVVYKQLRPLLETQERELEKSVEALLSDVRPTKLAEVLQILCDRPPKLHVEKI